MHAMAFRAPLNAWNIFTLVRSYAEIKELEEFLRALLLRCELAQRNCISFPPDNPRLLALLTTTFCCELPTCGSIADGGFHSEGHEAGKHHGHADERHSSGKLPPPPQPPKRGWGRDGISRLGVVHLKTLRLRKGYTRDG
jgi:hypothetical protein